MAEIVTATPSPQRAAPASRCAVRGSAAPGCASVVIAFMAAFAFALTIAPRTARADERPWCAPELTTLDAEVCYFAPPSAELLVIFLHGLVAEGSEWQWEQQRLMVRLAQAHSFAVLMPRGRGGIGPGRDPKVIAWPTSPKKREGLEATLIEEWLAARRTVERDREPFQRVLVFGFSNGAYYAASLALRGRLDVTGYGVFAGGSGNKYESLQAAQAPRRVPIFLGYGTRDPDRKNQRALARLLAKAGWKHRVQAARVGHTVTDAQISAALRFLAAPDPNPSPSPPNAAP